MATAPSPVCGTFATRAAIARRGLCGALGMERCVSAPGQPASLRLDKLLFFLRLARTRSLAQDWASAGHIRIGGRRVERAAHPVAVGDVVTLPLGNGVLSFELLALPVRRGPAPEARDCYRPLDAADPFAIAAPKIPDETTGAMGSPQQ